MPIPIHLSFNNLWSYPPLILFISFTQLHPVAQPISLTTPGNLYSGRRRSLRSRQLPLFLNALPLSDVEAKMIWRESLFNLSVLIIKSCATHRVLIWQCIAIVLWSENGTRWFISGSWDFHTANSRAFFGLPAFLYYLKHVIISVYFCLEPRPIVCGYKSRGKTDPGSNKNTLKAKTKDLNKDHIKCGNIG